MKDQYNNPYQYPGNFQQSAHSSNNQRNKQDDKGSRATIIAAWIGAGAAILAAIIGGTFGLIHLSAPGSGNTPAPATPVVQQIPQLRGSYNAGSWTTSGQFQSPTFSMAGIEESSDGSFTAAGGNLGLCNLIISNGSVQADKTVTFSIEQIADVNTNCLDVTADLRGTITPDGSSLRGSWSGQWGGQPLSGQWDLL